MSLYLDTEFNGFGGELVSMGIATGASGNHFYEVLPHPDKWHPWVAENVVPILDKKRMGAGVPVVHAGSWSMTCLSKDDEPTK